MIKTLNTVLKTVFSDFLPRIPFILWALNAHPWVKEKTRERRKKKEKLSILKSEMSLDSGENCKDHNVPQLTFTQLSLMFIIVAQFSKTRISLSTIWLTKLQVLLGFLWPFHYQISARTLQLSVALGRLFYLVSSSLWHFLVFYNYDAFGNYGSKSESICPSGAGDSKAEP